MANVVSFLNPDEVFTKPRRFIVEDRRCYIITASDEQEAFDTYCEMSEEEASKAEVDGGRVDVYPADQ